jgi:undecaprenyl pyrophosphate synthase
VASESSTQAVPAHGEVPRHVAVIMDGNGRWAKQRHLPRFAGHKRGVEAVRGTVQACAERGVQFLTLFAFSSENWRRPADEVALLMQLFHVALTSEVGRLHRNGIRLRLVGDLSRFDARMRALIDEGSPTWYRSAPRRWPPRMRAWPPPPLPTHLPPQDRMPTRDSTSCVAGFWEIIEASM